MTTGDELADILIVAFLVIAIGGGIVWEISPPSRVRDVSGA